MDASAAAAFATGELAEARSRAYHLFGALLARGFEPTLLEAARQVPQLGDAFAGLEASELAAGHHELLTMQLFPFAGVFEDREALIGGTTGDDFQRWYLDAGFQVELADTTADHLGLQLAFLSYLSGAEADAATAGRGAEVDLLHDRQRRFLDRMLHWLPGFFVAVRAQPAGPWRTVVELALALVADHRDSLGGEVHTRSWAAAENILDDDKTGTRRIARLLCAPAFSGVFLTRRDLTVLGRAADVPRGFGSRVQMLGNLLLNAAEYGEATEVLERLDHLWAARIDAYATLATGSAWRAHASAWHARAEQTRGLLGQMLAALEG